MKSLILGGDSFLGKALRDLLGEECFYTSRHLQQDSIYFDLLIPNFTVFRPYLQDLDVVYLTAAITSMADCQEDVQKSYKKIMKKIHPDLNPELNRLAAIVNESKEIVLKDTI